MIEKRRNLTWWRATPPPAASVWPQVVGHIDADEADRHRTVMDHFVPHVVCRGRGTFRNAFGSAVLEAGDLFCLWPGDVCEYGGQADEPWEFYWLHLDGDGAQAFVEGMGFRRDRPWLTPQSPTGVIATMRTCAALYERPKDTAPSDVIRQLLALVDHCVAPTVDCARTDLVADATTLMRSSLHTGLNINDVCDALGVHRVTLLRQFQRRFQCSPHAYLTQLRMERAAQLLTESAMTIEEVATAVGFDGGKYLMRCFRAAHGKTPGEWRKVSHV